MDDTCEKDKDGLTDFGREAGADDSVKNQGLNSKGDNGWTPIMTAAAEGNYEVFNSLYSQKADLSLKDDNGESLLHLAARGGNTSVVERMLKHQSVDCKGKDDFTPVMAAAEEGHWNVFCLLIKKGADTSVVGKEDISLLHCAIMGENASIKQHTLSLPDFRDNSGRRKLWKTLMMAARNGNERVYDSLVSRKSFFPTTEDEWNSILLAACEGGSDNIVRMVIKSFSVDHEHVDEHERTPLMIAAAKGHQKIFELLMRYHSKLDQVDKHDDTILHLACQGGSINIVRRVLRPSKINAKGRHGWTPIAKAVFQGFKDIFDLLLEKGADVRISATNGDSLLHLACVGGSQEIVDSLLAYIDINKKGEHGWTPLIKTVARDKTEMYEFLVSKGADVNLNDKHCNGVLHYTASQTTAQHLVACTNTTKKGKNGWTPLMKAAVTGNHEVFTVILATLVKNGGCSDDNAIHLKMTDNNGDSLLHLACRGGNIDIVKTSLQHVQVDTIGRHGWTPVMTAVYYGHKDVLELLLNEGADLTLLGENDEDILSITRRGKKPELRKIVLSQPGVHSLLLKKTNAKR